MDSKTYHGFDWLMIDWLMIDWFLIDYFFIEAKLGPNMALSYI